MSEVPQYTIRIKPPVVESGDNRYTYGCPIVMLTDVEGNEVARLMGINGVAFSMEHEQFTTADVTFAQFECDAFETMFPTKGRRDDD